MSSGSKIEWTDATWNPVVGCKAVSPGCDHCYAARDASGRLKLLPVYTGLAEGGVFNGTVRCLPERLDQPLRWRKPRRIFVNSMSDLFHPDVPDEFIKQVLGVMLQAPWHTFQVLTKRPQRMSRFLKVRYPGLKFPPAHIWWGTSIESDEYAFRANHLRVTPVDVRFLSLEPLLGPLPSLLFTGIDWVIVGGESGPGARPMHIDWVRDIRDRCRERGIPFFFKQWGAWHHGSYPSHNGSSMRGSVLTSDGRLWDWWNLEKAVHDAGLHPDEFQRLYPEVVALTGKKAAGRELDGRTWDEYPS